MFEHPTENDTNPSGGALRGDRPKAGSTGPAKKFLRAFGSIRLPGAGRWGFGNGNSWLKWGIALVIILLLFKGCYDSRSGLSCWFDYLKLSWEFNKLQKEQHRWEDLIEKNELDINPCTTHSSNGKNEIAIDYYDLGDRSGTVTVAYDMAKIPDMMELYYDGEMVATTGDLVSGEGQLSWNYIFSPSRPTFFMVKMVPSQNENTVWSYNLYCPR
jgi:hypothetical protein